MKEGRKDGRTDGRMDGRTDGRMEGRKMKEGRKKRKGGVPGHGVVALTGGPRLTQGVGGGARRSGKQRLYVVDGRLRKTNVGRTENKWTLTFICPYRLHYFSRGYPY